MRLRGTAGARPSDARECPSFLPSVTLGCERCPWRRFSIGACGGAFRAWARVLPRAVTLVSSIYLSDSMSFLSVILGDRIINLGETVSFS